MASSELRAEAGAGESLCTEPKEPMTTEQDNWNSCRAEVDAENLSGNAVDISSEHDGGLLKEIKKAGNGDDSPCPGDTVFVHYVGTLTDGTQFDSSRDRDQQFDFVIGQGKVIKGWDIGVATMKRGEVAILTCKSSYAYGDAGSPPTIPPKATLQFEVELFDWKGEDLSEAKDEGILRTRLQKGEGFESPNDGASCEAHITGRYNDQIFQDCDVTFVVGEGPEKGIIPGIEQAIKKFIRGEKSKLEIKAQYAYGTEGSKTDNIPPGADLTYEVTLKTFEKAKESWEMDSSEKLEQSALVKDKGTKYFKESKYELALKYYQKIITFLEYEDKLETEEADRRRSLILAGHLNSAMCHLKMGCNLEAMNQCDKALDLDTNNEKGLFRRATAHMNMKNYEDAVADFQMVLKVDQNNKAAKNQITLAQHNMRLQREKEKQTYAGMFSKFAKLDAKKQPTKDEPKMEVNIDTRKKVENGEQNSESAEEIEVPMEEGTVP